MEKVERFGSTSSQIDVSAVLCRGFIVANAIGTVFNYWLLLNIVGILFIVQEEEVDGNDEELPLKSVRWLYYTIKYIR